MFIGTFGVFRYYNYDERTNFTPVMRGKTEKQTKILKNFMGFTPCWLTLPVYYLKEGFEACLESFGSYRLMPPFRQLRSCQCVIAEI